MTCTWIEPNWPTPPGIQAVSTLRHGGSSLAPYAGLNLGAHVGDEPARVRKNRELLRQALNLPSEPIWLNQVHGNRVVQAPIDTNLTADAAYTCDKGVVLAVMTADCLPILLASPDGRYMAAVHAGWKGLINGVIEACVAAMQTPELVAWLGPCIGPDAFEVGADVHQTFISRNPAFASGFRPSSQHKWLADLHYLARIVLRQLGITAIHDCGDRCTYRDRNDFFSYRRDQSTGRMATLIWRD